MSMRISGVLLEFKSFRALNCNIFVKGSHDDSVKFARACDWPVVSIVSKGKA